MAEPGSVESLLDDSVDQLVDSVSLRTDSTIGLYLVAKIALRKIRARHGIQKAAELAYKLADDLGGEPLA